MEFQTDLDAEPVCFAVPEVVPPRDGDVGSWAARELVPALDAIAESLAADHRLDLWPLLDLADWFDEDEELAWTGLLRRLQEEAGAYLKPASARAPGDAPLAAASPYLDGHYDASHDLALYHVIRGLNEHWLAPRDCLLMRHPGTFRLGLSWPAQRVAFEPAQLLKSYTARFAEGGIPVFVVGTLGAFQPIVGVFDRGPGCVVLDWRALVHEAIEMELLAQGSEAFTTYRRLEAPYQGSGYLDYGLSRWRAYQDRARLVQALLDRVCLEEVRHGLDSQRTLAALAPPRDSYHNQLLRCLLAPNGQLDRLLRGAGPAKEPLFVDHVVEPGRAISELSASFTAAACAEPHLVVLEWWLRCANLRDLAAAGGDATVESAHTLADILATLLVGEQLRLGPALTEQAVFHPDFSVLAAAAANLQHCSSPELRLAMKAVYQANFRFLR